MVKEYVGEGESLGEGGGEYGVIWVGGIREWEVGGLLDNVGEGKEWEDIKGMEEFDEGWGSILYGRRLKEDVKGILDIDEVEEWGEVFGDGKLLGGLEGGGGELSLGVKESLKKGRGVDIVVEGMGGVKFEK